MWLNFERNSTQKPQTNTYQRKVQIIKTVNHSQRGTILLVKKIAHSIHMRIRKIPESRKILQQSAEKLVSELEDIQRLPASLHLKSIGLVSTFFCILLVGLIIQVVINKTVDTHINILATGTPIIVLLIATIFLSKKKTISLVGTTALCIIYLSVYVGIVWVNKSYPINFLPVLIAFLSVLASPIYALILCSIAITYSAFVLYDPANGVNPLVSSRIITSNILLTVVLQLLTRHYKVLIAKTLEVTSDLRRLSLSLADDLEATTDQLEIAREIDLETGVLKSTAFSNKLSSRLKLRPVTLPIAIFRILIVPSSNESLTVTSKRYNSELLRKIFTCIQNIFQDGLIGRTAKWEFVVSFDIRTTSADVKKLANSLLENLQTIIRGEMHHLSDTVYIGGAIWSKDGQSADQILDATKTAVTYAQSKAMIQPTWYRPEMHNSLNEIKKLVDDIDNCIESDQLFFEYQPVFSFYTNKVEFYECLIRWKHPTLGTVSPSQFLPIAINGGQIIPITKWCLKKVADLSMQLNSVNELRKRFSVNISPKFLQWSVKNREEFLAFLDSLASTPKSIILEITEESFISLSSDMLNILNLLRSRGFEIALDDFGAGYSSLSQLATLPLDYLKLDISLISGIDNSVPKQKTFKAIFKLGTQLGVKVIAEGVETKEELDVVTTIGATLVQGYVLEKPLPEMKLFV